MRVRSQRLPAVLLLCYCFLQIKTTFPVNSITSSPLCWQSDAAFLFGFQEESVSALLGFFWSPETCFKGQLCSLFSLICCEVIKKQNAKQKVAEVARFGSTILQYSQTLCTKCWADGKLVSFGGVCCWCVS